MKICIGIISYMPDKYKEVRSVKLNNLLKVCDELFKVPIIIVAQSWNGVKLRKQKNSKITIFNYKNPLGITGARRTLRKHFLESEYDYLIMLDDDCEIIGTPDGGEKYIAQIKDHPDMYGVFKTLLLKLFAISKKVYSLIDYPDGEPVRGDFFEDMWLLMALDKLYPDKKFIFNKYGLNEISNSGDDASSTWYHKQVNKRMMGDKTRAMIKYL